MTSGSVDIELQPADSGTRTDGWVTVIFNNDHNSIDDVVRILMVATQCPFDEAYCEMWEAHTYGKASCHFSSESECRRVAETVSSIGVRTEVRKEWS